MGSTTERELDTPPVGLEGVLERIIYANESNAWSVVRLRVAGRGQVTAVGNLLGVQPGENLRLRGWWVIDNKYGEQFRVKSYITVQPSTLVGIEKYLGSGLVPGLGEGIAKRIVERFQLETLDVIEKHPERLTEVEGIGPVRSRRITQAWAEQREIKEVMVFLQSHGVSPSYATRIYKQYGERAVGLVRQNPYRLAADIAGIGFKSADKIAADLGIPPDSPRRAEAAVCHVLRELADDGHLFAPRERLVEITASLIEVDDIDLIEHAVDAQVAAHELVLEPNDDDGPAVYLKPLHVAEQGIATHLQALLDTPSLHGSVDIERAIDAFEREQHIMLALQQREALRRAADSKVLVVTGGPGTGKTTLVNGIIRILEQDERRIVLCAPTGRAAKRMSEATGYEAKTIHRLLQFSPRTQRFEYDAERPLEADLVIVDEVSMIDVLLFYSLLRAIPPHAQLVLVGDVDQLPSVGPGNVLRDLIRARVTPVVTLDEIFRQARQSRIVLNAHRINQGEFLLPAPDNQESDPSDSYFIERDDPEAILATVKELVVTRIPRRFGVDPVDSIQVLTPMRRGLLGVTNFNAELQGLLNPHAPELARGSRVLRAGDKVMQIRNNYDLDVYNGDIGRIIDIDNDERQVTVAVDGRPVVYENASLDELVLAYACSIHKAQGSEYPVVVLPLHTQHYAMLQRNLLYTAITRAKLLLVIVGSRKAVSIAVRNDRVRERCTRLADRLTRPHSP